MKNEVCETCGHAKRYHLTSDVWCTQCLPAIQDPAHEYRDTNSCVVADPRPTTKSIEATSRAEGGENPCLLKNWLNDVPRRREENLAAERDAFRGTGTTHTERLEAALRVADKIVDFIIPILAVAMVDRLTIDEWEEWQDLLREFGKATLASTECNRTK